MTTTTRKEALFDLLDDPSPTVKKALLDEFARMGLDGFSLLKEASQSNNRILSWHARQFLAELDHSNPVEELREFIRSQNYELETGSLLIARVAFPNLDVGSFCEKVDIIASRCRELLVNPASSREKCIVLNRVLFHELGFRGNSENYNDPNNSFLNCVLSSRKGLPISLSILYIIVAQRIGLQLEPIGIPGHFLVGCFDEPIPFYLDPFERGCFYTIGGLRERIEGANIEPEIQHLAPTSIRETLSRCCRNLVNHYTLSGQLDRANLFRAFIEEFQSTYEKKAKR